MLLIQHRVNKRKDLSVVPAHYGIEIDLRDSGADICCAHDPFSSGEPLCHVLGAYSHALAIFNVKADGLEQRIIRLAREAGVQSYFFLDCANPTLVNLVRQGLKTVAVRYSEYEPIEFALAFAGKAEWVWVDCFSTLPIDSVSHKQLRRWFKICIVSPELQGHPRERIAEYKKILRELPVDAVCTDFPEDWA